MDNLADRVIVALTFCVMVGSPAAQATNLVPAAAPVAPCDATTKAALNACQAQATSSYMLAVGACDNEEPSVYQDCIARAKSRQSSADAFCASASTARAEICHRVGQGIYDPAIWQAT
jgi:hypothetical protein